MAEAKLTSETEHSFPSSDLSMEFICDVVSTKFTAGCQSVEIVAEEVTDGVPQPVANGTMAYHFVSDARNYLNVARIIQPPFEISSPRYFLLCHAIELCLKAYILASGGEQSELKGSLSHRLKQTFERAVTLGYQPSDERVDELVTWLSPFHEDYSFRYKKTGRKELPPPETVIEILASMLVQIEPVARAAYRSVNGPPA